LFSVKGCQKRSQARDFRRTADGRYQEHRTVSDRDEVCTVRGGQAAGCTERD